MENLEERLEARLLDKELTKKEIVGIVSEECGVDIKVSEAERNHEAGCDEWFSIDKQIAETTDAYIDVFFETTENRAVYKITEVDVDIFTWEK